MPNRLLVDSSFLYAILDTSDRFHREALIFPARNRSERLFPDVILAEVAYLLIRSVGHHAVLVMLTMLVESQAQLVPITLDDLRRPHTIMAHYADARLDIVDCCIMALAERLNITQIATFDRRDFQIFRPVHCDYLELLP